MKLSNEAKVGIFVLIGIIILFYFTIRVGTIKLPGKKEGIKIIAKFDTVAGLERKAIVRYAGVKVGYVDDIKLVDGKAVVYIRLNPDVKIKADAYAEVGSLGLLGEKYIEIKGGSPLAPYLEDGDVIKGNPPVSIDQIVSSLNSIGSDVKEITETFKGVLATKEGKAKLDRIFSNLDEITFQLKNTIKENQDNINKLTHNLALISEELKKITYYNKQPFTNAINNIAKLTEEINRVLPDLVENLNQLLKQTNEIMVSNKYDIESSIDNLRIASLRLSDTLDNLRNITEKIRRGEGTLGKLISDTTTHENLNKALTNLNQTLEEAKGVLGRFSAYQTKIGYHSEYLKKFNDWRSTFSMYIYPKKYKYYIFELISSPFNTKSIQEEFITTETEEGTKTEHIITEKYEDKLLISFQVAREIKNWTFRGGIIENTGGVGLDFSLFNKKLLFSIDAYDFASEEKFKLKIFAKTKLYNYFDLYIGWDNILNKDNSYFFGAGISFYDEDLKYLIGILPISSLK